MMAKYGSNSLSISLDNSGGTPVAMTAYVTAINAVTVEALLEESHSFGDSWFESLATGIRRMSPVEISGIYDDGAAGPDAIFNSVASAPSTSTRTLLITWGGSKTTSVETVITSFTRGATRNELTSYSVTLTPTGTVTEA
jgi:hypothetical protein